MDCDFLNFWHDASSNKPLLPDSQCSKLISQNQLATLPQENQTDSPDISQGARRNNNFQAGEVITKIEDIFESLLDCIINEKKCLVLHIKSRAKSGRQTIDATTGVIRNVGNIETKEITFPGKNQKEAWKFSKCFWGSTKGWPILTLNFIAALLRILELSHEALVTGIVTTKR
jgi:meiotic recombination protein SPO11